MSTQERIKFDARLWENCFNADPEDAYVAGALSERNKVIEEVQQMLKDMVSRQTLSPFDENRIFNKLQSLKV